MDVTLDSLDGVPEAMHGLFTESDGKFVYQSKSEDTSGLKSALEKERKAAQRFQRELQDLKGRIDPDRYQELLDAEEKRATEKAKAEGDFESLKAKLVEKHAQDRKTWEEREAKLLTEIRKDKVEAAAALAINEHGANATLLMPHIQGRTKVVETEDGFAVQVLDAAGEPMVADSNGTPLGIGGLVEALKQDEKYQPAFPASGRSGSGASEGSGGGGRPGTADRNDPLAWSKNADKIASGEMTMA